MQVTVIINVCEECTHIKSVWNAKMCKTDRKCTHPDFTILDSYVIPFPYLDIPDWCPLKHGSTY